MSCGPVPRQLTFTLNDWEPAIHARNLMMLQLVLDLRNLLEPVEADMLHDPIGAMGVSDSPTANATGKEKAGEAARQKKSTTTSKSCNTKAGSRASQTSSKGLQAGQGNNLAFAQRIGVIFCAMYNVFVDANVLQAIQDVAGRLVASSASSREWTSTELGRLVRFADDRSQDRVRDILALYADKSLQRKCPAASVRRERSKLITKRMPEGLMIVSRCMGLASLRQKHSMRAYDEMVRKCELVSNNTWLDLVQRGVVRLRIRGRFSGF